MSKPSKLLSFARTSGRGSIIQSNTNEDAADRTEMATAEIRSDVTNTSIAKKKPDRVATNLRLTRDQWRRVHELALDEETTVQDLAIRGLSRLFEERGLPRL